MFKNIAFMRIAKFLGNNFSTNCSDTIASLLQNGKVGDKINIKGWIRSLRKQKSVIFLDVSDGSTVNKLQIVLPSTLLKDQISPGASVNVSGTLGASPTGQVELCASDIELYGQCVISDGYPLSPKKHYTPEYIRQYLHFRPRTQKFSSLLRVRSAAITAIHDHYKTENYIQIHTPTITSNDCEGAGEVFKVTPDNNDLLKSMVKEGIPLDESFFSKKAFLTVSGQLHLEVAVHGLSKVYSLGPTFRAENSKSRLHLSEFYMLEAEIAFIDELNVLIEHVEHLLKSVTKNILNTSESDINYFGNKHFSWLDIKFPILTYTEAKDILINNADKFEEKQNFEKGFSKEEELFLVNYLGGAPVFVTNFPKNMKPFYAKECLNDTAEVWI